MMFYREKKIYSGEMLEVEIYPISLKQKRQPRRLKIKESLPKQKKLNNKNAMKHFIRLVNRNFTNLDLSVCLTYKNGELPIDEKEARKDITNWLRRIKHYRKKHGLPALKYLAVIEYGERKKRIHHHIILSGDMDRDVIEELWTKGRANADRLKADECGYEGLARYICKDPQGNKRWVQSRNIKQPIYGVNDCKFNSRKKIREVTESQGDKQLFTKLYPGYFLSDFKVKFNEINSGTYIYIKMRKLKI